MECSTQHRHGILLDNNERRDGKANICNIQTSQSVSSIQNDNMRTGKRRTATRNIEIFCELLWENRRTEMKVEREGKSAGKRSLALLCILQRVLIPILNTLLFPFIQVKIMMLFFTCVLFIVRVQN